jgi:hypothetical protein
MVPRGGVCAAGLVASCKLPCPHGRAPGGFEHARWLRAWHRCQQAYLPSCSARTSRVIRVTGELHWFPITQRQTRRQLRDLRPGQLRRSRCMSRFLLRAALLSEDLMVRTWSRGPLSSTRKEQGRRRQRCTFFRLGGAPQPADEIRTTFLAVPSSRSGSRRKLRARILTRPSNFKYKVRVGAVWTVARHHCFSLNGTRIPNLG